MDISKIELTYPLKLTDAEKNAVFNAFMVVYPEETRAWIEIERVPDGKDDNALREVSNLFRQFVLSNMKCDSNIASASLFMEIRGIIHKEHL